MVKLTTFKIIPIVLLLAALIALAVISGFGLFTGASAQGCENLNQDQIASVATAASYDITSNDAQINNQSSVVSMMEQECSNYNQSKDYHYLKTLQSVNTGDFDSAKDSIRILREAPGESLVNELYPKMRNADSLQDQVLAFEDATNKNLEAFRLMPVAEVPEGE